MNNLSRKDQIEQTATALFKSRGYAATSMRDLATAMGLEAASLYSHIKSKEEILQRICFRMANEFFEGLDRAEKTIANSTEKLRAAIKSHLTVLTKQPAASAVFQNEWKHLSEPFLTDFQKLRYDYENHFRQIIKEGNTSGEFTVRDEKMATLMLLSSLNFVHTWYKPEGKLTPEQISETLSNMLLNGIVSGKKRDPTPNPSEEGNFEITFSETGDQLKQIHQN
ncbi:TetR/AcrR family transcriptional regulator [Adhaeribacter soli]|uniref:TetR/AcrR family transcriptional regulator n=1 Tax=Adhaeribacter soli TaxID=2607655 RepID=A0A5N1IR67_9BACT|nr:TetR/AcrR family transcriptional regulator [Adhaeribacter soli]KAA9332655.1 TetR/AcrR family transcriptional regulator [Adhaeribacter soli]